MPLSILSVDVGMKNLGVCLFNITGELTYEIECWDVLNLCDEQHFVCGEKNKKGQPCNKNAKFCKNDKYYCKIHAKKRESKIPPQELNIKKVKKLKFINLKALADKYDMPYEAKKLRKDKLLTIILKHIEEDYLDPISIKKATDMNLVQYGRNLKKEFNKLLKGKQLDGVIVENQIGPLAMRMKTLQGMIMQHFIERDIPLVEQVSASNKLKEFLGNKKTTYSERKKESIRFTQDILLKNNLLNKWTDKFNKHKKKDDLADSFLQGRWYLQKTILNGEKEK